MLEKLPLSPYMKTTVRDYTISAIMHDGAEDISLQRYFGSGDLQLGSYKDADPNLPYVTREGHDRQVKGVAYGPYAVGYLIETFGKQMTVDEFKDVLSHMSINRQKYDRVEKVADFQSYLLMSLGKISSDFANRSEFEEAINSLAK